MNYKLALKLKEAGFPFKDSDYESSVNEMGTIYSMVPNIKYSSVVPIFHPTLSELIEACGLPFCLYEDGERWIAARENPRMQVWENFSHLEYEGSTPEEAVANLWLKLNGK